MHSSRPVTNNSHAFENRRTTKKTRRIGRQILLTAAREGDETTSTTSFMDSMNIASRGDVVNVTSSGSSTSSRSSLSYVPEEEDGDDDEAMAFPQADYKKRRSEQRTTTTSTTKTKICSGFASRFCIEIIVAMIVVVPVVVKERNFV